MKIAIDKKRLKLYLWLGLAYLSLWLFIDLINTPETFFKKVINNIWLVSYLVVVNFTLFEYTLPFIKITWKRILIAPLLLFAHLMLYSFGLYAWRHIGIQLYIYFPLMTHSSAIKGVEYHMPYSMFSVFFFGVIRYTYDYRKLKEAAQQLRIEKQEAELNYLKSQTNPHFLFNTLNNIYVLAREKSDLAPESILRLSKILRFMLYEAGGSYIAIEHELKIISDYIALEQLRYDESLRINFNHDVEDMRQALPPLLMIPLVENAFKHGVSETRGHPYIDIHLSVNNRQLTFIVKNSTEQVPGDQSVKENIGLSNLRRQLALLYREYNLSVEQSKSAFIATLKINLASHV
jgi:two-component system, LytTR family, sensor kinase